MAADRDLYTLLGIYTQSPGANYTPTDFVMTLVFDCIVSIINLRLVFVYKSSLSHQRPILHSDMVLETPGWHFLFYLFLFLDTVFNPSVIQLFLLLMILGGLMAWTLKAKAKDKFDNFICWISRFLLLLQLLWTFVNGFLVLENISRTSDYLYFMFLFGFAVQDKKMYLLIMHQILISFALVFSELFRITNAKYKKHQAELKEKELEDQPALMPQTSLVFGQGRDKNESAYQLRRARTRTDSDFGGKAKIKSDRSESKRLKNQVEQFFKNFSPHILLWILRLMTFTWAYAYHDYQSMLLLTWICHSTIFWNTKRFIDATLYVYLPIFVLLFVFYYVI